MPLLLSANFHVFGAQHIMVLCMIAALALGIVRTARKGTTAQCRCLKFILGLFLLSYAAFVYIQQGIEHNLTWQYSLPLEFCHLVLIACLISLIRPFRLTAEIAYFWGFGGVLQATLTPDLTQGFPSWDFILFFWGHGATLLAIMFLIFNRKFKPGKGSVARMMIALNAYGLVIGTTDAVMGWNYGYLCRKPSAPSLLDLMGPWPWYLLSIEATAFLSFALLSLPWRLSALSGKRNRALSADR